MAKSLNLSVVRVGISSAIRVFLDTVITPSVWLTAEMTSPVPAVAPVESSLSIAVVTVDTVATLLVLAS